MQPYLPDYFCQGVRTRYRNLAAPILMLVLAAQPVRGPHVFIQVTESSETKAVHASGDPAFDEAVAQFTRAVIAMRSDHPDSAASRFERVAASSPALGDWSHYLAAQAAATRGDTAAVRAHLAQTRAELQRDFGWQAQTLALEGARDFRKGAALADSVARASKASRSKALAWTRAARMLLELGDSAQARKAFLAAIDARPESDAASEAASQLTHFKPLRVPELRALARVARAQRQNSIALRYYREARKRMSPGPARAELVLETGRFLFATRQYNTLRSELKTLAQGRGELAGEALLLIGRTELRDRNGKTARRALLRCLESDATAQTRAIAAFLLADVAHDAGNRAEADRYFRSVIALAPHSQTAANAYMRRGGMAFARGDFTKAAEIFAAYRTRHAETGNAVQAKYWLARSLASLGKTADAMSLLKDIEQQEPYSYYGVRARRITGDSAAAPAAGPESAPATTKAAMTFARVVRLLRDLELYDAASYESSYAQRSLEPQPGGVHAYAEAVQELGGSRAGIAVGREVLGDGPWDSRLLRIVYPFPYRDVITREARKNGLAPDFVAAFIRQESLFEPRARSPVGALGLMQLMPPTARALDRSVDQAELLEPEPNVRIGTAHLRDLLAEYGGHTERLMAAYNAGGTPVARWSKFPESRDPELFVERIPYDETREYVKIVQRNAWLYSWLYDATSS